ncbi:hypothetical protein EX895_004620 [Sporisorium graminicola]|uniref:Uncharacterized protein n=1 Tax=Sporisorium graminicola TaxID=280036 RepID=A0A4U7KQ21_9BASI|nr:hypothetical protein EX895_004620 [Sporisorium graminicola]TKY86471.1 hypothetical protein EX895_004620 [Sporisorium graminicola]
MLPETRDSNSSYPSSGPPSVSDKEEIARAALRSLAAPSASPTSSHLPPLPRAPLPAASYPPSHQLPPPAPPPAPLHATRSSREYSRSSLHHNYRHDGRSYAEVDPVASRSSSFSTHDQVRRSSSNAGVAVASSSAALKRNNSSSSFFHDQSIAASPESSPRMHAASFLPPPPTHAYARHSIPSSTPSTNVHEVALRRASLALGVDLEDVRQIVHHAYSDPHSASTSSSSSYWPSSTAAQRESSFTRQVLHAYQIESDRASQPRSINRSSASSSAFATEDDLTWHHVQRPSDRISDQPSPQSQHHPEPDRSGLVAWGTRPDARLPTFETKLTESITHSAQPASRTNRWHESVDVDSRSALAPTTPAQRPESPSPFAYDAYRRPSHPAAPEFDPIPPFKVASRASHGFVDETARNRALEQEHAAGRWTHQSHPSQPGHPQWTQNAHYERRIRSIDDYVEQQQPYTEPQRHRSGSMAHYQSRAADLLAQDDRLPDRTVRSTFRHSYQPYPSQPSRNSAGPPTVAATGALVESPQLSPTMPDPHRFHAFSQVRSPAAETPASVASSSVASAAALSPSPLLGPVASSSTSLILDSAKRTPGAESDAHSSLRAVSEDTAAESTRAGVESMQIDDDDAANRKAPRAASRKSRSLRSSFSQPDRSSGPIHGTDLSHSAIMQKLQDKVKSRLVAKGKAALLDANKKGNGTSTSNNASGSSSIGSRAAGLGRAGSIKRTASTAAKSSHPERAPAPTASSTQGDSRAESPSRTTATAEKSAAPVAGAPAAKVRRTSASSQQKLASEPPSQTDASKPSSPARKSSAPPATIEEALQSLSPKPQSPAQTSDSKPNSIEAALLSPTDTPTPSEAANLHAQRLSRSPLPPEGAVETASGQALPGDLPAAGQMNASSATKQQSSKSGIDSLIQAANNSDPTESSSAIA